MGRSEQEYLPEEDFDSVTPPVKGKKRVHRWTELDTRLLPHAIQKALNNLGIAMPWDEIAREMKNGQSGTAIAQHLTKDIASLRADGVDVPSPLRRGGNRNPHPQPVSTARLAPISSKVSKNGAKNLSRRAKEQRERRAFKKNPSKFIHRDDTPPPYPRSKGQYTLACAPIPRMIPAFAQRELRPYPPPFLVEPSEPAIDHLQGRPFSRPSAPAVLRTSKPITYEKPSALAGCRPPPSSSAARQESVPVPPEEAQTPPDYNAVEETVDPSGAGSVQEDIDFSDSNTDLSDSESEHESTDPSMQGITNHPVYEPVHDSSSFFSDALDDSSIFESAPEPELTMENYLGPITRWPQNENNTMAAPTPTPYDYNGHDLDPAAFLQDELNMMYQDLHSSY